MATSYIIPKYLIMNAIKVIFYDIQVRSSFMTFCKADCYGSAEVKMLITKYILVKASDVELHKFCPDSLDADPSHR